MEQATYMVASAGEALWQGQALGAQVLLVDPPRRGLDEDVLQKLCKPYNPNQPYVEQAEYLIGNSDNDDDDDSNNKKSIHWTNDVQTLIYVSCGFEALARDCHQLVNSAGGWMVAQATGYILFPGSDHVETVCVFVRH